MRLIFEDNFDGVEIARLLNDPQWDESMSWLCDEVEKQGYLVKDFENWISKELSKNGVIHIGVLQHEVVINRYKLLDNFVYFKQNENYCIQ